jgi:hypothetical protein
VRSLVMGRLRAAATAWSNTQGTSSLAADSGLRTCGVEAGCEQGLGSGLLDAIPHQLEAQVV